MKEIEKLALENANLIWNNKTTLEDEQRELNGHIIGFKEGYGQARQTHPFTQQDLIEFADYVRENDLKCNAKLDIDIKYSKDLFDIWVTERLETINFKK